MIISEHARQVCELVSKGYSIDEACSKISWPVDSFYDEKRVNKDLDNLYMDARGERADVRFERFEDVEKKVQSGELDPVRGRFLLESIKWRTAKEKPKVYGDKQQIEHTGNITLSALIAESIALPAIEDKSNENIIDVTPVSEKIPSDYI